MSNLFVFCFSDSIFSFSILRLSHPRLRSFSIASRCFESRWVRLVLACFTWFCSASCRVNFNYVVSPCSFYGYQIRKHNCWVSNFKLLICNFQLLCFRYVVSFLVLSLIYCFQCTYSDLLFSVLRLSHPRLHSFSIASRRFESRWAR